MKQDSKLKTAAKRYTRNMILVSIAYVVILMVSITAIKYIDNHIVRVIIALTPMIPIILGLGTFTTYLSEMDELERKIHFEGFAFSIAITGMLTFSLGLLDAVGYPTLRLIWVFPMLIAFWGIGSYLARRRYM